jgi:hypothetical protein
VYQGLRGVREAARVRKRERFTALPHHLTVGRLRESFDAQKRGAARCGRPGMGEYENGLDDWPNDLHGRVHRGAYPAQPSRSIFILKEDGRQSPLGVASLENKIIRRAVVSILNEIYEAGSFDPGAARIRRSIGSTWACAEASELDSGRLTFAGSWIHPRSRVARGTFNSPRQGLNRESEPNAPVRLRHTLPR